MPDWKMNAVFVIRDDNASTATVPTSVTEFSPTTSIESTGFFFDDASNNTFENGSAEVVAGNLCLFNWSTETYVTLLVFSVIFFLSVIGNSTVIIVILKQSSMRSITNIFLLNLAVADLLLSVVCMPSTVINNLCFCWPLGDLSCTLFAYLQPVSVAASSYTLAVIAVERYSAICRPLRSRTWQTRSHAYQMIALVWLVAFLSNAYLLFKYYLVELDKAHFPGRLVCQFEIHKEFEHFILQIYLTVVLLLIPLCMMIVLYGLVIHSLKAGLKLDFNSIHRRTCYTTEEAHDAICEFENASSVKRASTFLQFRRKTFQNYLEQKLLRPSFLKEDAIGTNRNSKDYSNDGPPTMLRSTHSIKAIIAKQRLIRMLMVIVILFFCCWTPNFIYWLIQTGAEHFKANLGFDARIHMTLLIFCYLSSCTNPITYCFLNKKFRTALLLTFGCRKAKPTYLPMIYLPNASPAVSQLSPNQPSEPPSSNRNSINGGVLHGIN